MKNHKTERPHDPDNFSLVDVSDLRDPSRDVVRKLGSGDWVLLCVSLRNDRGSTDIVDMPTHISRAAGPWPDRWFVGLIQADAGRRPEIHASGEGGFVTFRSRHILDAWPQPAEGWEDTAADLRTALVKTLARKSAPGGLPRDVIFATMQRMIDNQGAVLYEIAEVLEREVE